MNWRISRKSLFPFSLAFLVSLSLGTPLFPVVADDNLPDVGLPGRRVGGATRSPCVTGSTALTALTPKTLLGTTLANRPTISVYVPPNTAEGAEIGLEDAKGNKIYQTQIQERIAPGMRSFSFDQLDPDLLKLNQSYKWYFQFICNLRSQDKDDFVEGWVQRVNEPEGIKQQLEQVKGDRTTLYRKRADIYSKQGLWYEMMQNLILAHQSDPKNTQLFEDWKQILCNDDLSHLLQVFEEVEEQKRTCPLMPNS